MSGQMNVRAALDALNGLLHDGYNFIKGIGSYTITASQRAEVFTAYGWVAESWAISRTRGSSRWRGRRRMPHRALPTRRIVIRRRCWTSSRRN